MVFKSFQNAPDPSKVEVGEIDTSAPFASVKAAVSMFGESSASPTERSILTVRKPKLQSVESPLAKERQLHLAQRELKKFKDQLDICVTTRVQALSDLEKDREAVAELQTKLETLNQSKIAARKVTEDAKSQMKDFGDVNSPDLLETESWKEELEAARKQYAAVITELDHAKQELRKIKRDLEFSRDAKISAIQQEATAKQLAEINSKRADQLSQELATIQDSIMHVKLLSSQSNLEESNKLSDKDTEPVSYKLALEETEQKLAFLREQYDPKVAADLEIRLEKITSEIDFIKKELGNAEASDQESTAAVVHILEDAKSTLKMVVEEECSLRSLVDNVKFELENTKKIHMEMRRREEERETLVGELEARFEESKIKLETASAGELKMREACDDLVSTLNSLSAEAENARREAESMRMNAKEMRNQTEASAFALGETEKQLHIALVEAEMAKAAEVHALNEIKVLSEKANLARSSSSESVARITISADEFELLGQKLEETEAFSGTKVAAALAEAKALKASEHEANRRIEAIFKEIMHIETETEMALKRAEISDAAKRVIEREMKKLHEVERKKGIEAEKTSVIDLEVRVQASPSKVRVPKSSLSSKLSGNRMMRENFHTSKRTFIPNLVGIFHKKKNQPDVGSPSYVSSEKPGLLGVLD